MANLTSTQDVKQALLQHAGELTNGNSSFDALAITYINRIYQQVFSGEVIFGVDLSEPWPWARQRGTIIGLPKYDTGTVGLTNGSANGTFSSAPATSAAGRYLKIVDRPEYYRIASHTGGNASFTLDSNYADDTGAALSFSAHALEYTIPASGGIARLIEPMVTYRSQTHEGDGEAKVYAMGSDQMLRRWPLTHLEEGVPTYFAIVAEVDGVLTLRFNKSPAEQTRMEYEFVPVPADLTDSGVEIPLLPRSDREVLVFGGTHFLMLDKEDSRADMFFRLTQEKLQSMVRKRRAEAKRAGKLLGTLVPRQEEVTNVELETTSGIRIL